MSITVTFHSKPSCLFDLSFLRLFNYAITDGIILIEFPFILIWFSTFDAHLRQIELAREAILKGEKS